MCLDNCEIQGYIERAYIYSVYTVHIAQTEPKLLTINIALQEMFATVIIALQERFAPLIILMPELFVPLINFNTNFSRILQNRE